MQKVQVNNNGDGGSGTNRRSGSHGSILVLRSLHTLRETTQNAQKWLIRTDILRLTLLPHPPI